MIIIKSQLSKREKENLEFSLQEFSDIYGDFYITKDNLRLFLKENSDLLFECLKKGDKIAFGESTGFAVVFGYSDNAKRKYLKLLTKSDEASDKLVKVIQQNVSDDLYAKIKKNNPVRKILEKNNFRFVGDRGKEILLKWSKYNIKGKGER